MVFGVKSSVLLYGVRDFTSKLVHVVAIVHVALCPFFLHQLILKHSLDGYIIQAEVHTAYPLEITYIC